MNKYLRRGLIFTTCGAACCILGYYLMDKEIDLYKWVMAIGVVIFGIGFLTVFYSFIRKIERQSILEERKERQHENE
ncbi:signal peptidase [Parapedobacter deserti]|uniref:Signal peptidase n=1 Tax=Parapedobacter deserti TaxID=1912957 RepID=A0ABV7JKA3_9SPHI